MGVADGTGDGDLWLLLSGSEVFQSCDAETCVFRCDADRRSGGGPPAVSM